MPFNVLVSEQSATIIDWEYAGILPYLTSLARLIAHGQDKLGYLFYMKEEDKAFAVRYYYDRLVKDKGISWEEYFRDLQHFLLYEYCEWIMLHSNQELYDYYFAKAKVLVSSL